MAKKRNQRKFKTLLEIDIEILKHKRQATALEKVAAEQTRVFKNCIALASDPKASPHSVQYWNEQANYENKKLSKIRKSISSIFEMQIPRLVRTRAAMQTVPFPFMDGDRSVVMQNER